MARTLRLQSDVQLAALKAHMAGLGAVAAAAPKARQPASLAAGALVATEADILHSVIDAIAVLRLGEVVRYNAGGMKSEHGQFVRFNDADGHSDLAGTRRPDGRAFYFEVKRAGLDPTAEQQAFLDRMASAGAIAECVHSVEEAVAALRRDRDPATSSASRL